MRQKGRKSFKGMFPPCATRINTAEKFWSQGRASPSGLACPRTRELGHLAPVSR